MATKKNTETVVKTQIQVTDGLHQKELIPENFCGLSKNDSLALKGLAVLLLVFHHCYRTSAKFAAYEPVFQPLNANQVIQLGLYAKICVSIFAFVSGYGLLYSYNRDHLKSEKSTSDWVRQRLFSTLSGYWIIAILSYILFACLGLLRLSKWGDTPFQQFGGILTDILGVSNLLGVKSLNGAWWYISAAIVFILFLPVLACSMKNLGWATSVLIIFVLPRVFGFGFTGGTSSYPFLMAFVLGMSCCHSDIIGRIRRLKIVENRRLNEGIKFFMILMLVLFGVWSEGKVDKKIFWEYSFAIIPFFVIVFFVVYIQRIRVISDLFSFLGKHSMNIWLTHSFVRDYLPGIVWKIKYFLVPPVVILLISLIISMLLEYLKRITGWNTLMNKLNKQKNQPA